MKYDWEDDFECYFEDDPDDMPPEYVVVALAVVNTDTGEAALIQVAESGEAPGSVVEADYCRDIAYDANSAYEAALEAMQEALGDKRRLN